jgi:hypothetical protein
MGNNTSRTVIRGEFKPSKPLSRKSLIMNIQNYSFGDASPYVIENIDNITQQTIEFLSALQTNVVIPLNSGMIDETPQTKNILEYLLNLRLIKVNEVEGKKQYSFVSTTYQDQPNIGQTYNTLLTEYIDLLKTLGTYYSDLTLTKLETDNANQRDIVAMKTKINDKSDKQSQTNRSLHEGINKHAINGFVKSVAREVGTRGITVNSICPGLVMTDMLREKAGKALGEPGVDGVVQRYTQYTALQRCVTPEEIAALAVFLASDASSGITGGLLSVDGGSAFY